MKPDRPTPPRAADRLLEWFVAPHLLETLQGDLHEEFAYQVERIGESRAQWRYWRDVLGFVRPYVMKREKSEYSNPTNADMIRSYIKIALRNLWRSKGYAAVNVVGLSVAFCICLFLFLVAYRQLTFDSFHKDGDRIFQTYFFSNDPDRVSRTGGMPLPLTPALKGEHPEIEAAARVMSGRTSLVEYRGKYFDKMVVQTDPDFLKLFSFPLLKGSREVALRDLSSIVISETMAKAVFADEDPIGKRLLIGSDKKQYIVTGIIADSPDNSSIHYDALARIETAPNYQNDKDSWQAITHWVFIKVAPQVDQAAFEARLKPFTQKYFAGTVQDLIKKGAKADERGDVFALRLQKLANVHFDRDVSDGKGAPIALIYVLIGIAVFILSIACINFINMSIARSFTRAKEVGVRKSLGALRNQLFVQIWSESTFICLLGFIIGAALIYLLIGTFNSTFQTKFTLTHAFQPGFIAWMVGVFLLVTLVAGGYPAWQMAKFNAVEVLKGKVSLKRPGLLRNSLIVTQFAMSTLLACCTIIAIQQVDYMRQQPVGFDKEQVISIPVGNQANGRQVLGRLRNRLANDPTVLAVTGTSINLGKGKDRVTSRSTFGFTYKGKQIVTDWLLVDYDYLKTLNIKPLAGRDFDPAYAVDSVNRVVVTESMAKLIDAKHPIGAFIKDDSDTTGLKTEIIGVIPDFHLYSVADEARPIAMHLSNREDIHYIFVRVATQSLAQSMDRMKQIWREVAPQSEFLGSFLDENVDGWYQNEEAMSKIFSLAASIAMLLSCLGLFAIALLVIEQRTKEIGIRKVLGASVPNIVVTLSRDFVKLVLIALAIAVPLAWLGMQKWLDNYAERITISIWIFVGVGVAAILVALATVSFHSIKAALMNPVKSLRSE
ncbi:permease prefix domain 2-containing transporter [Spirosoma soli]|uniref:Permease prefix domain 2-containing transporter n=1 Tax=Spirosoma soli TaxID=1770529 RepID=A0ABW5M7V4_9BACT